MFLLFFPWSGHTHCILRVFFSGPKLLSTVRLSEERPQLLQEVASIGDVLGSHPTPLVHHQLDRLIQHGLFGQLWDQFGQPAFQAFPCAVEHLRSAHIAENGTVLGHIVRSRKHFELVWNSLVFQLHFSGKRFPSCVAVRAENRLRNVDSVQQVALADLFFALSGRSGSGHGNLSSCGSSVSKGIAMTIAF